MINHNLKFIFIHIPKAAGTSIETSLTDNSCKCLRLQHYKTRNIFRKKTVYVLNHLTAKQMIKLKYIDKIRFHSYFKFCFVRNPWDRVIAEILFMEKRGYLPKLKSTNKFYEKIKIFCALRPKGWSDIESHLHQQYEYIYDKNGKLMVEFIGRFERLQEDFEIVCDKIGIKRIKLPHHNKTEHKHYSTYYNDETINIVAKRYSKDIDYFNYKFEKES